MSCKVKRYAWGQVITLIKNEWWGPDQLPNKGYIGQKLNKPVLKKLLDQVTEYDHIMILDPKTDSYQDLAGFKVVEGLDYYVKPKWWERLLKISPMKKSNRFILLTYREWMDK